MQTRVILSKKKTESSTFPCVKIWREHLNENKKIPLVVLFSSRERGVALSDENGRFADLNYHVWVDANSEEWADFEGAIEFKK